MPPRLRGGGAAVFGVSSMTPAAPAARWSATFAGTRPISSKRPSTSTASAKVVGSGTVGPEPTTSRRSPATSERTMVISLASPAASARYPPLIDDRCFRTVLNSAMSAPEARSSRLVTTRSSRLRSPAGSASNADDPPETRYTRVTPGPADAASSRARWAAATLARFGSGWPPTITGTGACSSMVVTAMPRVMSVTAAKPRVMATAALPEAMTTVAPASSGAVCRLLRTARSGSAAATASRKIAVTSWRGFTPERYRCPL